MRLISAFRKARRRREEEHQARVVAFTIGMMTDDARRNAIVRDAGHPRADADVFRDLAVPLQLAHDMFRDDQYTESLTELMFWIYRALEELDIPMPKGEELQDKEMLLHQLSELSSLAVCGDVESAHRHWLNRGDSANEQRFRNLFPMLLEAVVMLDTAQVNYRQEIILADSERFLELTGIIIPELQRLGVRVPRIPDSRHAVEFKERFRELRDMAAIGALDAARKS